MISNTNIIYKTKEFKIVCSSFLVKNNKKYEELECEVKGAAVKMFEDGEKIGAKITKMDDDTLKLSRFEMEFDLIVDMMIGGFENYENTKFEILCNERQIKNVIDKFLKCIDYVIDNKNDFVLNYNVDQICEHLVYDLGFFKTTNKSLDLFMKKLKKAISTILTTNVNKIEADVECYKTTKFNLFKEIPRNWNGTGLEFKLLKEKYYEHAVNFKELQDRLFNIANNKLRLTSNDIDNIVKQSKIDKSKKRFADYFDEIEKIENLVKVNKKYEAVEKCDNLLKLMNNKKIKFNKTCVENVIKIKEYIKKG